MSVPRCWETTLTERLHEMIRGDEATLAEMEAHYPGIRKTICSYENAVLPACTYCKSPDMAQVIVGIVGITMAIAGATSKVMLVANHAPGTYRCNACRRYFD